MSPTNRSCVQALRMNVRDDVACLLDAASEGDLIEVRDTEGTIVDRLQSRADIPRFHKVALRDLREGEHIVKYGEVIGTASLPIARGDYVHVHNIVSAKVGDGK